MKALVIGENGQLGWELKRTCPENVTLTAVDYPEIDLVKKEILSEILKSETPDWVINAAAYTAVDKAEEDKETAYNINHKGVENLCQEILKANSRMVHISTDFIFDGDSPKPYRPDDEPNPKSVYGDSKLKGEYAVLENLKQDALIIRTAWLYSSNGNNFVLTMIRLMKEKDQLTIIDDQVGTPTWACGLAKAVWASIENDLRGTFHWTDAGVASWYDFGVAIQEEALALGLLRKSIPILPIPTEKYPTPAKRPVFSVLNKQSTWESTHLPPIHWREQLRNMLKEMS
jgi:dTDP-4-dehydrorhamnose reductase